MEDPFGAIGKFLGHKLQISWPAVEYVFTSHSTHDELELLATTALAVPAEHGEHASDEVLPVLALYVPGGQDAQSACELLPVLLLYVPG